MLMLSDDQIGHFPFERGTLRQHHIVFSDYEYCGYDA